MTYSLLNGNMYTSFFDLFPFVFVLGAIVSFISHGQTTICSVDLYVSYYYSFFAQFSYIYIYIDIHCNTFQSRTINCIRINDEYYNQLVLLVLFFPSQDRQIFLFFYVIQQYRKRHRVSVPISKQYDCAMSWLPVPCCCCCPIRW